MKSQRLPPLHKVTKMAYPCVNIHVFQYFKKSYSTLRKAIQQVEIMWCKYLSGNN